MTLVMAHRGASHEAPENTLAAFTRAVAVGADVVELDVRLTADGALAVIHDPRLPDGRLVHETDAADLPPSVPLLDAALDACAGVGVNVELKNDPKEPGFDASNAVGGRGGRPRRSPEGTPTGSSCRRSTSRPSTASETVAPAIETAYLVKVITNLGRLMGVLVERGHRGVHPWHGLVTRRMVGRCHAEGLAVRPWTVDDPDRMRGLAAYGVEAICTNEPAVAGRRAQGSASVSASGTWRNSSRRVSPR